jgi:hypothetical protein
MKLLLLVIILLLMVTTISNVYASGPRLDYDERYEDVPGAPECWVDGYDAGFAGKYIEDRANECADIPGDQYNASWKYGCKDAGYMPNECEGFKNNPVDIEDHEALQQENAQNCWNDGYEDGKADNPINKDRDSGCGEYTPDYRSGYNSGCIIDSTEDTCELLIKGHKSYCPWHPDIAACVEFLHNATNKRPATTGACEGMGDPRPNIICPQESNPEGYCLNTDDPAFCKTIGDICDTDGFVKPEYPYCTK